jgi:hypothetical protein
MALLETLDSVPWGSLYQQDYPTRAGTYVPKVLRTLAEGGPNATISYEVNAVEADGKPTQVKVARPIANELTELMQVSAVTPRVVPFMVELAASELDLATRRACVRWLQSFFKYCSTGYLTASYDVGIAERDASYLEALALQPQLFTGMRLGNTDAPAPGVLEALELTRERLGEFGGIWELSRMIAHVWQRDIFRAIAKGLAQVLGGLEAGDQALSLEIIALASWIPEQRAISVPKLEKALQSSDRLVSSAAMLALARLGHQVTNAILVMSDEFESKGERGLPALYLACADVFATKGNAGPKSRRALLKVAPELARLPDPFSTTVAETVKLMSAKLVWAKK